MVESASLGVELAGSLRRLSADLYVWPTDRSYVRQPTVELHLPGSPPLLEAALRSLFSHGARLAQPGEFTLRAVLGGRMDLTQAEAVLGVIDARGESDLQAALGQLSGGLAGPLGQVREELLGLLADLEAGLDFVEEEDVRFVEPEEVLRRLDGALGHVAAAASQAASRSSGSELPAVVLTGPPNAGKSTLFNALRACGEGDKRRGAPALVSEVPGSTRDQLSALLSHRGLSFAILDTAGIDEDRQVGSIESAAQSARRAAVAGATVVVACQPADESHPGGDARSALGEGQRLLSVRTKSDLGAAPEGKSQLQVSAKTGHGLPQLLDAIVAGLEQQAGADGGAAMVASTATRCREALAQAEASLRRARELVPSGGDELVSLELRCALDALGRVVGAVVTDDVLDRIFSRFCIGK